MRTLMAGLALACALIVTPAVAADLDPVTVQAIENTAYDYVDGQLEGDAARVARSLHPDLAKRAVKPSPDETLGLRRMTKEELIDVGWPPSECSDPSEVTDDMIRQLINHLREILSPDIEFIESVPGRGYRLFAAGLGPRARVPVP